MSAGQEAMVEEGANMRIRLEEQVCLAWRALIVPQMGEAVCCTSSESLLRITRLFYRTLLSVRTSGLALICIVISGSSFHACVSSYTCRSHQQKPTAAFAAAQMRARLLGGAHVSLSVCARCLAV